MSNEWTISIPSKLHVAFGEPGSTTPNVFEQEGDVWHALSWFNVLRKVVGEVVALPTVSLLVPVSRNAIHKRIKEGKLSVFKYTVIESGEGVSESLNRGRPHAFVPVLECKLWFQDMHDRTVAREGGESEDIMLLDDDGYASTLFDHHSRDYSGLGKEEYQRMTSEYFERRKAKYGW